MDTYTQLRTIALILTSLMLFKYLIYMVIAPFYPVLEKIRRLKMIKKMGDKYENYNPRISVIIPAWNEEVGVVKTINSIVDNDYPNTEIIVVPNNCSDKTEFVVSEYIDKFRYSSSSNYIDIKTFPLKPGGKGIALNYGIIKATGDIILTVDADSVLRQDALTNLKEYFKDPSILSVVGNVKIANNYTFIGLIQRLEYIFGFYFKRANAVMGSEYIFGGACAAFRREVFDKLGLFDTTNKTEDIEMSMRVRDAGLSCTYAEDVVCYTEGASTVKGLIDQRLRWKKGRFDTFIKYRHLLFSTEKRHNKFLSWVVFPYALLSEFQLLFEPISISLLIAYSFISGDYVSIALGVMFVFVIYFICSIFTYDGFNFEILLLFPVSWMLFYFLVWIEFLALFQGLHMLIRGQNIEWQKWDRHGVEEIG